MDASFARKSYWEERLSKNYSLGGVGHLATGKYYNYWVYKTRGDCVRRILKKMNLAKNSLCLDIGSGTGFYLDLLNKAGFTNIEGSDLTDIAVTNLKKNYPSQNIISLDISSNKIDPKETYDLITCMDVMFHITDNVRYENAFKNISNLLKKGGYLVLTENFCPVNADRGHIHDRTKQEILGSLESNELEIETIVSKFILLNPPVQTRNKWLCKWNQMRITVLKKIASTKFHRVNWLIGLVIYSLDQLLVLSGFEPKGTSIIVCRKI